MVRRWIAVTAAIILLLTGCNKPNDEPVKEHKGKELENVQKEKNYPNHYPLTGIGTIEDTDQRPVAVMVNNHPKARQQVGLDKADMVYEVLAEGSVTRFLAIFQSERPERIGPVRSARDYYIELAKGYDSFFVAHGYSPEAEKMLKSGYIDNINGIQYDGSLFKRSSSRSAPHNSYITFKNVLEGAKKKNASMKKSSEPVKFLSKEEQDQLEGSTGNKITVSYYNNRTFTATYEYDTEIERYKRYSNGAQTVNEDTGSPVLLDNILIVETSHQTVDSAGRRNVNLNSGGKAFLLQKGVLQSVQWKNVDNRILPVVNGEVVGFVPGKTWINIVPAMSGVKVD